MTATATPDTFQAIVIDTVDQIAAYAMMLGIDWEAGEKFTGIDAEVYDLAETYLKEYTGDFAFVLDIQRRYRKGGGFTDGQARGVANCALAEARRRVRQERMVAEREVAQDLAAADAYARFLDDRSRYQSRPANQAPVQRPVNANLAHVPSATYTVVLDDEGDYLTLALKEWKSKGDGTRALKMLVGPNNDADYQFVGGVNPDGSVWLTSRFKVDGRLADAVGKLAMGSEDDLAQGRHAFALLSGTCARCGRTLTVPSSLYAGLGPDCAGKLWG